MSAQWFQFRVPRLRCLGKGNNGGTYINVRERFWAKCQVIVQDCRCLFWWRGCGSGLIKTVTCGDTCNLRACYRLSGVYLDHTAICESLSLILLYLLTQHQGNLENVPFPSKVAVKTLDDAQLNTNLWTKMFKITQLAENLDTFKHLDHLFSFTLRQFSLGGKKKALH